METIVFLCNGDEKHYVEVGGINNSQLPDFIKTKLSAGSYYITDWSCWNSKFIKVEDRAYLQRSGSEPRGFIARGKIIAAPEYQQLRLQGSDYSDLSEAYAFDNDGCFYVYIQLDSVVDFDFPLEQRYLAQLPQFRGVNFNFGRGGARFDARAAAALDNEWEKHSLIQQRNNRGRRVVDVFLEKGDKYKQKQEYQAAIDAYKLALKVDSNYSKAKNKIQQCESILKRIASSQANASSQAQDDPAIPNPDKPTDVDKLSVTREELDKENFFTLPSRDEAQRRMLASIVQRQGQTKFRQNLLKAYEGKCAITDFDAEAALEAAHIIPYSETENNEPSNGLLLRADLHTLFDLNYIVIHPETMQVHLSPAIQNTEYRVINGKRIRVPKDESLRPSQQFLRERFKQCSWFDVL